MRSTTHQPDFAERQSPLTRPGFVLAAVLVLVIVVLGVVVAFSSDDDPAPVPPPAAGASDAPQQQPEDPAKLPTKIPATPPPGVTWQVVRGTALPFSDKFGPREHTENQATGFAHSPEGALLAAAQITSRVGAAAGRKSWEPTLTQQFVAGADRDKLRGYLDAEPEQEAQPGDLAPLAGYLYQSYTPDAAVIGLAYRSTTGNGARWFIVTTTLTWSGGDWKMIAPAGGAWTSVSRVVTDLTGVVEWGAR